MDLRIRRALPAEFEELGALTADAYLGDSLLELDADDPYLAHLRDVAHRAAAAEVLVAEADTQLLGTVTFVLPGSSMTEVAQPGEAEIRMLAVDRTVRGRGTGEALVRACVDRARSVPGCVRLVLSTHPAMHAAHRIYDRLGFARTPGRDWDPFPGLTLLCYELALGPDSTT